MKKLVSDDCNASLSAPLQEMRQPTLYLASSFLSQLQGDGDCFEIHKIAF
jgi:hypothetical protein